MDAPSNGSVDQIALRQFKAGARSYDYGDKVDETYLLSRHLMDEPLLLQMKRQGYIGDLTPYNFSLCMAHHPAGHIPRGFTAAYLLEKGIIDALPEPAKPARPDADATAPKSGEPRIYGGCQILTVKVGRFTRYEVRSADGDLLRTAHFQKPATAERFIDGLSTGGGGSDTPGAKAEAEDDADLRSKSGDEPLQGASGTG